MEIYAKTHDLWSSLFAIINVLFQKIISPACRFEFLTKAKEKRRQFSKFWFPPLNFLEQKFSKYNIKVKE